MAEKNDRDPRDSKSKERAFKDFVLQLLTDRFDYEQTSPKDNVFHTNVFNFEIIISLDALSDTFTVCQREMGNISSKRSQNLDNQKCTNWFNTFHSLMD